MLHPLLILFAAALAQLLLGGLLSPRGKGVLALLGGLGAFGATLAMLPAVLAGQTLSFAIAPWDSGVDLALHVDGLSLVFLLIATGIGSAILLYCIAYMAAERSGLTRFYALILTFIGAMAGLVSADHLLIAYLCWEVIGLCSYLLVGFWYRRPEAANGARKVLVITHLAGYGFLAGALLLFARSGSFSLSDPALSAALSSGIFVLLLTAAMAKSVLFPLHTWIPEAMNAPTPVSALLHSACYVKAGVYLIARLQGVAPWPAAWSTLVVAIGCATMLVGALFAIAQTDLKRLLAFSTISQLGYIVTCLGIGTPLGLAAGLFYALSHGLFKGTLFLCAGSVQHGAGTRDMRELGGLSAAMPHTTRVWLIAAAAIVGVPLTNGFVAKWLLYDAALAAGLLPVVMIALLVSTITAFYMLKATVSVFYGQQPAALAAHHPHEAPASMLGAMWLLGGLCLLFGVAPQVALLAVAPAVLGLTGQTVGVSWLGISSGAAVGQMGLGAGLALAALGGAGLLYRAARPARPTAVVAFTGGDPLPATASFGAEDFSALAGAALRPIYEATDPDDLYLAAWRRLQAFAGWVSRRLTAALERRPLVAAAALAVAAGLVALLPAGALPGGQELHADFAPWRQLMGLVFGGLLAAVALLALDAPPRSGRGVWWGLLAVVGVGIIVSAFVTGSLGSLALDGAAIAALLMVWTRGTPEARRAARVALLTLVPAMAMIAAGSAMIASGVSVRAELVLWLLLVGFGLKLALLPFSGWLPGVAGSASPLTTGLIVGVVDIGAFLELAHLRVEAPWLFERYPALWVGLALLAMVGGSLMALAQTDIKRMLAFSTIDDMGYLLLGVVAGPGVGLAGALLGALAHGLLKVLLFGTVAVAEAGLGRPISAADRGLAKHFPVCSAVFIAGSLGVLGVPPLIGFVGRWRLYLAGLELGGPVLLAAMIAATAVALLAYVRTIHRVWLGPGELGTVRAPESPRAAAVLVLLMVAGVALGLAPHVLTGLLP